MRIRKSPEPDAASEEQALEKKVDAMMDPKIPDPVPATPANGQPPAIDIFKDLPEAPVETIQVNTSATRTAPELTDSVPTTKKISVVDADRLRSSLPPTPAEAEVEEPDAVSEPAEPENSNAETAKSTTDIEPDNTELKDTFNDAKTEAAVDQIAKQDGDKILAIEDAATDNASKRAAPPKRSFKAKLKAFFTDKRTWIGFAAVVIILGIVPWTRYKVAGLVIHKSLAVTIVDAKTGTPVSGALVSFNGSAAKTNASGKVDFRVAVGNGQLKVTKQYYVTSTSKLMVGFGSTKPLSKKLTAIGRQVPLTVVNKISGQPLANAVITVLGTTAKTNTKGQATIVLPASSSTDKATVSLAGYNTAHLTIQVTSSVVAANNLRLVPTGKVYFLSNASGSIGVVSTNLDGSNRQTVFAGTGNEDPNNTILFASRDRRYLVLQSVRSSGGKPALYLIDTSDNKTTEFDSSNSTFQLIGWYGHYFMYDLTSNTIAQSQASHEVIKSYDADTQQLNQLDSTQAQGSASSYAYQTFGNFYVLNNLLVYTIEWQANASGGAVDLSSDTDTIRGVQPNGSGGKKDYQTFPADQTDSIQANLYQPQAIYYAVKNSATKQTTYYQFVNQAVSATSSVTASVFGQKYPTYLFTPSGKQTFWIDPNSTVGALFVGDANGQNGKQLKVDGSFKPYGWFGDNYLVASKAGKLYALPPAGSKTTSPVLIGTYLNSPQEVLGYGSGYGGL